MPEVIVLISQEEDGIQLRVVPVDGDAGKVIANATENGLSSEQYLFGKPKASDHYTPRVLALIAAIAFAHGTSRAVRAGAEVVVPANLVNLVTGWTEDPPTALTSGLPHVFRNAPSTRRIYLRKGGSVQWTAPPDVDVRFVLDPEVAWCDRPHHGVTPVGESASPLAQKVFWTVFLDTCLRVTGPETPLRLLVVAKSCETFLLNISAALVEKRPDELQQENQAPPNIIIYLLANEALVLHPPLLEKLRSAGVEIRTRSVEVQAPYNFTMMVDAADTPRSLFWAAWSGGVPKNPPYEHVGAAALAMSPSFQQLCRAMHLAHVQAFGSGAASTGRSCGAALPPALTF